jgi:glutamyl-tRNA reductase
VDQRTKICPNHSRFESQVKCDKSIGTGFSKQENFNFNEEQAEIISNRIIKNTTHFANHLKDDDTMVDESIEWIEKVFKIGATAK